MNFYDVAPGSEVKFMLPSGVTATHKLTEGQTGGSDIEITVPAALLDPDFRAKQVRRRGDEYTIDDAESVVNYRRRT